MNSNNTHDKKPQTFDEFCLKQLGFVCQPTEKASFSIEAFTAYFLHTNLTRYGLRGSRLTPEGTIHLPQAPQKFVYTQNCEASIGREQTLMELCNMKVPHLDIYNRRSGQYVLSNFEYAFNKDLSYQYPSSLLASYNKDACIKKLQINTHIHKAHILKFQTPQTKQRIKEYIYVLTMEQEYKHIGEQLKDNFAKIASDLKLYNWLEE